MSIEEMVDYWLQSAEEDKKAANVLFMNGHFHWCLFLWHLTLEKLFKAKITKLKKEIPYTHNLVRLAAQAEIVLNEGQTKQLQEITTFNLEARYDDYKLSFYKKATQEYAQQWVDQCEQFFVLIRNSL